MKNSESIHAPAPHQDACCDSHNHKKDHKHGHQHDHDHNHEDGHDHDHDHGSSGFRDYIPGLCTVFLLLSGITLDFYYKQSFFSGWVRLGFYLLAYLPVAWPVIKEAAGAIRKGNLFNEFTLMALATIGAFAIGEYPEGVAVMLFYAIGELFQGAAVARSKENIKALLDVRPSTASVLKGNQFEQVQPETVTVGEIIRVVAGEKVPLDGELLSDRGSFDTSALTGESVPRSIQKGETVLSGMLNLDQVIELKVLRVFSDSSLAKILDLVQNASSRKAKPELLIRKFAAIYTPIVFFLALGIVTLPALVVNDYVFREWLYRGLVFLVISCPCALVISIPLGYFGGIGAASKHGILFKGANFLDLITQLQTVVMDKTGTLTKGIFSVTKIELAAPDLLNPRLDDKDLLQILVALESHSNHPVAKAIVKLSSAERSFEVSGVKEIAGHGLSGTVRITDNAAYPVFAGNMRLMKQEQISVPAELTALAETTVFLAIDHQYAGYVLIADELKPDAQMAIEDLKSLGVKQTVMLSGDKQAIVDKVAHELRIDQAKGDLLPEGKVAEVEKLNLHKSGTLAFVGDGINDTPVLALSDIGIAMGAMGSDAAIETADVVIQSDEPSKIVTAIRIGKETRKIVIQNITLAFAVKAVVLILGAGGVATMWEAVFADVGVALLAILNAVRIQQMKF